MDEFEQGDLEKDTNDPQNTFIKMQYVIKKEKMLS